MESALVVLSVLLVASIASNIAQVRRASKTIISMVSAVKTDYTERLDRANRKVWMLGEDNWSKDQSINNQAEIIQGLTKRLPKAKRTIKLKKRAA